MHAAVWSWAPNATLGDEADQVLAGAWEAGVASGGPAACTRSEALFEAQAAGPHSFLLAAKDQAQLVSGGTWWMCGCVRVCACVGGLFVVRWFVNLVWFALGFGVDFA
jgi:hypothetical protein